MSDLYWCPDAGHGDTEANCPTHGPKDRLVESRDAEGRLLALLVVDECAECDGEGRIVGETWLIAKKPCPSCGGRGWLVRADISVKEGDDSEGLLLEWWPTAPASPLGTHVVVPLPEGE